MHCHSDQPCLKFHNIFLLPCESYNDDKLLQLFSSTSQPRLGLQSTLPLLDLAAPLVEFGNSLELSLADLHLVNLIRSIGVPHDSERSVHLGEVLVLTEPFGTKRLHGSVDNTQGHLRDDEL